MRRTGLRVYEVLPEDFPLAISVEAVNMPANRAIIGEVRLEAAGVIMARTQPDLTLDPGAHLISYRIDRPSLAPANLSQTIDGFFDAGVPANAKYRIVIANAAGDSTEETSIRVPSINPGSARLTFQVVRSQA
jgi:hypothetical protein